MFTVSHRIRNFASALFLASLGILIFSSRPAHAWGADPIQVHATSALCPVVAVTDDAHYGAIVVWQEDTATGGLLKAQHVLANGDLDPAWGAGVPVSTVDVAREAAGAVSDANGGAYVWWTENTLLMLQHVSPNGTIAAGWSAHGRNLGTLLSEYHRPIAVADGAGGVYVGWVAPALPFSPLDAYARVVRLGPSGLGAGGWPTGGRALVNPPDPWDVNSIGLDRASDGGLWLSWVNVERGPEDVVLSGEVRALRVTPAGLPAAGWTADGVLVAPYDVEFMNHVLVPGVQATALVAAAHDDGAGAYVVLADGTWNGSGLTFNASLRHLDGVGAPAAGWTSDGVPVGNFGFPDTPFEALFDPATSMRAVADQHGGVLAGVPFFASEFTARTQFSRRSPAGTELPGGIGADQRGLEFAPRGDGGMVIASFKPSGATGPFEADAYVSVGQSEPGEGFYESKGSAYATRYGDIGLAATGDGGAIFAWSQLIDRQGIFAIRLGQAGQVTGVPPAPVLGGPALRVRFVRGDGVRAAASLPGARVVLALFDLTGRRVARVVSEAAPGAEVLFPGTRDLAGGVYFARASDGASVLESKVLVLR
jgi:hypothetical protein